MTVHLLNAAVMPHEGFYELKPLSPAAFANEVRAAHADVLLKHYIGYQSTLTLLEGLCKIKLGAINVEQTEMQNGDIFFVARLRRRVSPLSKRVQTRLHDETLEIADFDFFVGRYWVSRYSEDV